MKKFKTKKRFNNFIIYVFIFLVSISFSIKYLYSKDKINEDTLVDILVSDTLGNYKKSISSADFLIKYALNMDLKHRKEVLVKEKNEEIPVVEYKEELPILYIYNTHDTEKYASNTVDNSTVRVAAKTLKEYLDNLGIKTIFEEDSVQEKVVALGWKYGSSYKVSRMFLESAYSSNKSLKYFIDIHRDSSVYDKTTTDINGVKYARLLFVIGLDHSNYAPNLKMAEELKKKIDSYNNTLCRGIMKKSGKGVNGIYNQDFNENTVLIEIGGQYNNIEEVNNTLKILADILSNYIKERENG